MVETLTKVIYTNPERALREGAVYADMCIYRTHFRSDWRYLAFHEVSFEHCIFGDIKLQDSVFVKCTFKNCLFTHTQMLGCTLHSCSFNNCVVQSTFVNITTGSYFTDNPLCLNVKQS